MSPIFRNRRSATRAVWDTGRPGGHVERSKRGKRRETTNGLGSDLEAAGRRAALRLRGARLYAPRRAAAPLLALRQEILSRAHS
jgi:hypothetical protein